MSDEWVEVYNPLVGREITIFPVISLNTVDNDSATIAIESRVANVYQNL